MLTSLNLTQEPRASSPITWSPPSQHFVKLNFDGVTKNNLGDAGYGRVFRDSNGTILRIYAGNLGISSNNATELWVLLSRVRITKKQAYSKLIIEGDSQLIINMLIHLQNGSPLWKVSMRWRLEDFLDQLHSLIQEGLAIILLHVKREANNLVDHLANT
jgi:ribonuclease HI